MKRIPAILSLLLASLCLASCGAPAPSAPLAPPAGASNANTVTCSTSPDTRLTSKVRHVPNEDDPCGKSHGLAQPVSQP